MFRLPILESIKKSLRSKDLKERTFGFTLVELMVAISIVAVLAAISLTAYSSVQKNFRDAKRKADLASWQAALEQYHADQLNYPVPGNVGIGTSLTDPGRTKAYTNKLPGDPGNNGGIDYAYIPVPTSCTNLTAPTTYCTGYKLCAKLENPPPGSSCPDDGFGRNYQVLSP